MAKIKIWKKNCQCNSLNKNHNTHLKIKMENYSLTKWNKNY